MPAGGGAANVRFLLGDAQIHALPQGWFAVGISRFGTMFFADPAAAFANVATALAPGGRLCLATWQPLAVDDWLTVPGAALLQAVLATIPTDQHDAALDAVRAVLADHADSAGVHLSAAIWIVTARTT